MADHQRKRLGERRPSRQRDATKTSAVVCAPTRPAWLKGRARQCWEELVPQLVELGTVARADRNLLIRYCVTWANWRKCAEVIQRQTLDRQEAMESLLAQGITGTELPPFVTKGRDGLLHKAPELQIYRDLAAMLDKMDAELGLTPKARARLRGTGADPDDDADDSDGMLD